MRVDIPGTETLLGVPLGPDTYSASYGGLSLSGSPPANAGYTFEFTVVPEPAGLALLSLGGVALFARRRRA